MANGCFSYQFGLALIWERKEFGLVWFGFDLGKKRVWFGLVVPASKSFKSTAEDASNVKAGGLADGRPPDDC